MLPSTRPPSRSHGRGTALEGGQMTILDTRRWNELPVEGVKRRLLQVPHPAWLGRLGRVVIVEPEEGGLAMSGLQEAGDTPMVLMLQRAMLHLGGNGLGHDMALVVGG